MFDSMDWFKEMIAGPIMGKCIAAWFPVDVPLPIY